MNKKDLLLINVALASLLVACGGRENVSLNPPVGTATDLAASSTPNTVSASSPAGAPLAPVTLKDQIAALERSGAYPPLDRSNEIGGPDTNQNGIRDDIDAWIDAQSANDRQKNALRQKARSLQSTLLTDLSDRAALQRAGEALMASTNCLADVFAGTANSYPLSTKIESMTANTRERAKRYMQYNAARSGSSTSLPDHDTCEG